MGGKMKYRISDESLKATTRCGKDFSCLKVDTTCLCKVEDCINKTVYFIKCLNDNHCPYKKSFGMDNYCICPVRRELYDEYKI